MQQAIFDQSLNFTKNGTEKGKTKEFNNVDDLAQQEKAPEVNLHSMDILVYIPSYIQMVKTMKPSLIGIT